VAEEAGPSLRVQRPVKVTNGHVVETARYDDIDQLIHRPPCPAMGEDPMLDEVKSHPRMRTRASTTGKPAGVPVTVPGWEPLEFRDPMTTELPGRPAPVVQTPSLQAALELANPTLASNTAPGSAQGATATAFELHAHVAPAPAHRPTVVEPPMV
jgi:hypothetical protein